jgi:hypothetical protein
MKVISISSFPRGEVKTVRDQAHFDGFCKALVGLKTLNRCSMQETKLSLLNWHDGSLLTADELDAYYQYFNWGRA